MCQVLIGINNRITANDDLVRRPPVASDNSTRRDDVRISIGHAFPVSAADKGVLVPQSGHHHLTSDCGIDNVNV
ncbi:Lachesin [Portunus trituberculatus]|uniref:Lachesin n=1 Tax=Portunus trituberculatus TaxID=210409 RepID=A0A5B7KI43_PORTR|nr:Lachesin [Portunus trituberculatus]